MNLYLSFYFLEARYCFTFFSMRAAISPSSTALSNFSPEITDEYAETVSDRYIELYEHITGEKFDKAVEDGDIAARIEKNVKQYLASRK